MSKPHRRRPNFLPRVEQLEARLAPALLTTLANFTGNATGPGATGGYPVGGVIEDAAGDFFGTTSTGGPTTGGGTVFELVPGGGGYTLSTLVNFTGNGAGTNGGQPYSNLVIDAAGDLFGTTAYGGANGYGTVFELVPGGGGYTLSTLVNFTGNGAGTNGGTPKAGLYSDAIGDLFGTTTQGGTTGNGTVFELVAPTHTFTTLYSSFTSSTGFQPNGGVLTDSSGNVYGTTTYGGNGYGTVFELVKSSGYSLSTLVDFNGGNGMDPVGGVIIDPTGNIFGTTQYGGAYGSGEVFELVNTGSGYSLSVLASFTSNYQGNDGANPLAELAPDPATGNIFGVTTQGGLNGTSQVGYGTVFELVKNTGTAWLQSLPSIPPTGTSRGTKEACS